MDGAAFIIPPQPQQDGHLVAAQLVQVGVSPLFVVRRNQLCVFAVGLGPLPGVLDQHPALNQDIGLTLHVPAVGIAEHDLRVQQNLCADGALAGLPGVHIRVPVCIGAAVRVHGGVPAELTDATTHFVKLKDGCKLIVQDVGQKLRHIGGHLTAARHTLCVELQVVRGHVGNGEQHHTLQKVKNRGGEAVGLHALPLLANEEILVGLHAVIQVNPLIEGQPGLVFFRHLLGR